MNNLLQNRRLQLFLAVALITLLIVAIRYAALYNRLLVQPGAGLQNSQPLSDRVYQFPSGGRWLFPNYRLVALYGSPNAPTIGALGQQPLNAAIERVKVLAATYQPYSKQPILPTLEIITTIASATPTSNGDYSQELAVPSLLPWVSAAKVAGVYVVLDLQPGRANFLTQAKEYTELLKQPNVGLALDPEWRLKPNQVHLKQIGSVDANEINSVSAWLAGLVSANQLPQKLFLVQQFRLSMVTHRAELNTAYAQLAYVIQMDGWGKQTTKLNTWQTITGEPPANIKFGWKNFYKQDVSLRNPAAVMALVPKPWYVSYQ